jgi:phosphoribosylformylglycinamidine (FGAM) synthase PurS component
MHLKRNFGVGPNSITNVDLSDRNIEKQDFYPIRDWLAFLPVTDLNIDQNPLCISIQNYRYVLINDVRTLQRLNGCNITDEERANAFKKVQEMKNDLIYNPPNIDSLKLDNVG